MRAADRFHSPTPEELMEYVDGEGTPAARAAIEAHLATCGACQALVADQQRLTGTMQAWQVAAPPASLQAPQPGSVRRWWQSSRTVASGLVAAAAVLVVVSLNQRPRPVSAPEAAATSMARLSDAPPPTVSRQQPLIAGKAQANDPGRRAGISAAPEASQSAPRTPSVIRTAGLQIVAADFNAARGSVESIVTAAAGFVDRMAVTGDTSRARLLQGTLRIPGDRLAAVLARLRELGQVTEDTQGAQDVTDQIVDLDARMTSARATEQRLIELLRNRTGRLSDVLEVERELTRVRLDIERLDAEKTNVTRRVSYATIDLLIREERKESLDGPVSWMTRLKVAALDGVESALDSVAGVVLFALRAGPSLVFWGTLCGLTWLLVRRRFRDSPKPTVSE